MTKTEPKTKNNYSEQEQKLFYHLRVNEGVTEMWAVSLIRRKRKFFKWLKENGYPGWVSTGTKNLRNAVISAMQQRNLSFTVSWTQKSIDKNDEHVSEFFTVRHGKRDQ